MITLVGSYLLRKSLQGRLMLTNFVRLFLLITLSCSSYALDSLSGSYQKHYSTDIVDDHWVILGAIERIKGAVQPEAEERLKGKLTRWLWQIPAGHNVDESFAFLKKQVPASTINLFECDGRSCGLSNDFANQVFIQSILYGRDSDQKYWVGLDKGTRNTLWVIYGAQRSNKRVYLYVEKLVIKPDQVMMLDEYVNKGEMNTFLDRGYMVIKELNETAANLSDEQVVKVKSVLQRYPTQKFALVVHRYNKVENQRLVDETQIEAQSALDQIAKAGGFIQHLYAHGAGAMLPREGLSSRIELVELKSRK